MTVTGHRPARRGGAASQPPDGALVRLRVTSEGALAGVPPAPQGSDVSVSFSTARAEALSAAALDAQGYRTVGVSSSPSSQQPVADFVVPQEVIDRHPRWWQGLAQRADQTFNLGAGPVQAAFAEVLRTHREPLR